ncbi:MAG TPA: DNA mismatch repair protein MutS [Candidatus Rifleibacterium sp.]|nr:DNA mismatch repair protein MutS [Candidatus Rifleibacterium sp.]HPT47966.1 DNA mismatch repair protein MutS [Candidatus Rifleibacterium sp.]
MKETELNPDIEARQNSEAGLTPLMQQYKDIKATNPNAVLLFRCGDFYETFFEDAVLVARELQITLTARGKSSGNPVPLAGVPYHSIDGYIAKLVQRGFTVAICEQVEDPKKAKGLVKREVVRIITPGTVSDPTMLEESSNNYLAAFGSSNERFCLAAVELSTGEVIITGGDQLEMAMLPEEFTRLLPREILCLTDASGAMPAPAPWQHLKAEIHPARLSEAEAVDMLSNLYPAEHRARFLAMPPLVLKTLGMLADHLLDTQRCPLNHLSLPREYRLGDGMVLDEATLGNLELLPNGRNQNIGGTLFDVLNRTRTSMGARLLKRWLLKPLIDPAAINRRLDMVELFVNNALLLAETRELLKGVPDLERTLSKITLGSRNPRDLQALSLGLGRVPALQNRLREAGLNEIAGNCRPLADLTAHLDAQLRDELPAALADGGVIRDGISPELDELRGLLRDGDEWLRRFEEQEKQRTGIKTLKVRKNSVFGFFIEISKTQADQAPDNYVRKQTLTTGERFITAELKDYENKAFTAGEKSTAIEKEIYENLVKKALEEIPAIKDNAMAIATADVISSLAQLAGETRCCRPLVNAENRIAIKAGRHPVVEKFLDNGEFHPNDLTLNDDRRQAIITGPNMAGKSTYLRQAALIVLMAQVGSFVPADSAEIGVVDRIFTRVGASDNLVRGQSTFMVEMMEASAILKNASNRSLLILDEIGRGTSTFDGLSLAWSILEHLNLHIGARTLFATHYHELTDLDSVHKGVFNLNVGVSHNEKTGEMVFLHAINEGPASKSYGIEVARLAGLPASVIERAREILFELEKTELEELDRVTRSLRTSPGAHKPQQLSLFAPGNEVIEAISHIDVNNITPLEALNILNRLKDMTNG